MCYQLFCIGTVCVKKTFQTAAFKRRLNGSVEFQRSQRSNNAETTVCANLHRTRDRSGERAYRRFVRYFS